MCCGCGLCHGACAAAQCPVALYRPLLAEHALQPLSLEALVEMYPFTDVAAARTWSPATRGRMCVSPLGKGLLPHGRAAY